jgi:hypothetical protein
MVAHKTVISQCLSLLPTEDLACPLLNYDMKKLTVEQLVKLFITAQLDHWKSYPEFDIKMRAYSGLMTEIGIKDISSSQLSRRINDLDTSVLQTLFFKVVMQLNAYTDSLSGLPNIGQLRIIDATHIKLPAVLSEWAYVTKGWNVVKMHTRLVVASPDVQYPDKIVPSNGKVSDHEGGELLIELSDATYVMDRGYMDKIRMNQWIKDGIKFVIRLKSDIRIEVKEDFEVPEGNQIVRDAKVILGAEGKMEPVRMVEYQDSKGKTYKVVTTRWDLSALEIADIYKNRWMIELFFKWIKQSLRFIKVWSTKPQGIWNQMFIAMIAYILILMVKLKTKSEKSMLSILKHIQTYLHRTWDELIAALAYKSKKTSRGRQKIPDKQKGNVHYGGVALIKETRKKQVKRIIK